MALAGVGAAVKYIGDLLVEEAKYLYGVEQQVEELQDELEWMTCFLEDVDAKRDRDARMRKWIKHITWLAYQSEDIIESFILKVELQRRGSMMQKLKGYSCIMREAKDLHELGSDIDALKLKISTLTSRLHTYGIKTTEQGSSWSVRREQLRKSYAHDMEDENNIIGLDNDVKEVVNKLMDDDSRVVALWGVGGLGKTTLAKKVFHHQDVRQYFDACAWASISQQCNAKSVLKELLRQLTSDDEVNDKANHGCLMEKLCKVQREKKCLVVLDDIWKKEAWDSLKAAFPNERENSSGGKLMLTTRIESVAKYADGNAFIYKQVPLDDSKAWQLLRKKLGSDPLTIFGQDNGPKMKELVDKMLKHCGGLPLAIVVLGGILAAKKSLDEWKIAHNSIKSLLSNAKDNGLSCKEVLELSYYDLPFYLKPCFLYLGIFPEDAEISATKLIHLWMAEGFISTGSDDDDDEYMDQQESLEKVGEAYLAELVDRSMVQVGSTRINGRISTCRIHDLMRDLCLSKAAEENFLKVVAGDSASSSSSISLSTPSFTMNTRKRYRRLAVHGDDVSKKVITGVCIPNKKFNAPRVKSLFFCGHYDLESSILRKAVKQFRLLRVLDLVGIDVAILPKGVGELVHLRFLSIRGCWIQMVPSSIMKLKNLQTLDLRSRSTVKWSPDMIWRMRQLKHVYMPDRIHKPSMEERIVHKCVSSKLNQREGGLNHNLEVLINFMQLHRLKDVAELTNLRKLSVNINEEDKMKGEPLIEVADALQDCSRLNKMKLLVRGRILLPSSSGDRSLGSNMLPHSVTSLTLHDTKIGNSDALQILEKLPSLRKLYLLSDSYIGKDMTCSHGGFPKLVCLSVEGLGNLEEWSIERGAMPSLLRLVICHCIKLKPFPDGIKSISNLKELKILRMPKHLCDKVREWKESTVQHIPNIKIQDELDD